MFTMPQFFWINILSFTILSSMQFSLSATTNCSYLQSKGNYEANVFVLSGLIIFCPYISRGANMYLINPMLLQEEV